MKRWFIISHSVLLLLIVGLASYGGYLHLQLNQAREESEQRGHTIVVQNEEITSLQQQSKKTSKQLEEIYRANERAGRLEDESRKMNEEQRKREKQLEEWIEQQRRGDKWG